MKSGKSVGTDREKKKEAQHFFPFLPQICVGKEFFFLCMQLSSQPNLLLVQEGVVKWFDLIPGVPPSTSPTISLSLSLPFQHVDKMRGCSKVEQEKCAVSGPAPELGVEWVLSFPFFFD